VRWQKSVRSIARRDARGAARQIVGTALAPGRFARRADARSGRPPRGENGARSARYSQKRDKRDAAAGGDPGPLVTRRKAFRSPHASSRKGRARGGQGHTGQRRDARIARCGYRSSCATGMEPAARCPRRRRGTSDTGDVHGKGCSSRQGAGGPSLEAPRGAGLRSAHAKVLRSTREQYRNRESQARARSKLARAKARSSLP